MELLSRLRNDNRIRIFPEYFDKSLTRGKGRRLPTKLALDNPSLNELKISAQKLGFKVEIDQETAYPRNWQSPRGILFLSKEATEKTGKKSIILRDISKTVTSYARPKIQEFMKQKELENASKSKSDKNKRKIIKKRVDRKHKPSRRRR